jgi:uncharacterized membrane protein YeaQ/YmgE (transglycosylase-associated protein family)
LDLIVWLIVGLVAGVLARLLVRGDPMGFYGTLVLGLVGSLVDGFLGDLFRSGDQDFDPGRADRFDHRGDYRAADLPRRSRTADRGLETNKGGKGLLADSPASQTQEGDLT